MTGRMPLKMCAFYSILFYSYF